MGKYLELIRQHERTQPKDTVIDTVVEIIHPQTWRDLAQMTAGLEQDDPRLGPVLSALAACEVYDKAGDQSGFEKAVERVRYLMLFAPGALVHWRGSEGHRLKVLGPAPSGRTCALFRGATMGLDSLEGTGPVGVGAQHYRDGRPRDTMTPISTDLGAEWREEA